MQGIVDYLSHMSTLRVFDVKWLICPTSEDMYGYLYGLLYDFQVTASCDLASNKLWEGSSHFYPTIRNHPSGREFPAVGL